MNLLGFEMINDEASVVWLVVGLVASVAAAANFAAKATIHTQRYLFFRGMFATVFFLGTRRWKQYLVVLKGEAGRGRRRQTGKKRLESALGRNPARFGRRSLGAKWIGKAAQ
jgi:hypothetical protein